MKYTDPSGEKWWAWGIAEVLTGGMVSATAMITATSAATTATVTGMTAYGAVFPMTDQCYEVQKYISPIAFKPSIGFGSLQNGIGFDGSVGMLKGSNGYRFNFGATYYANNYGGYNGWETRRGGEWELIPFVNYSGTKFKAGEFSQTTGMWSIGDPFTNIKYENDMMFGIKMPGVPEADGGDRFRTAAVQMNFGAMSLNLNMFTGDPGLDPKNRTTAEINGWDTYNSGTSNNRKYRVGALSVGFGPLRIGRNSEGIRNTFQNELIHKNLNPPSPLFQVLDIAPSWYWYFGFSSGNTLW